MNEKPLPKGTGVGKALAETADLAGLIPFVGTAIEYLINKIPQVRGARAARMIHDLIVLLQTDSDDLIALLEKSEKFAELVAAAAEAAANARMEAKVNLLARVLHQAAGTVDDPLSLDTAHLRIRTLADLEAIHLTVLSDVADRQEAQVDAEKLRFKFQDQLALDAVLATLVRHGLLGMRDALVGFPGPVYHLTDFGRFMLDSFENRKE